VSWLEGAPTDIEFDSIRMLDDHIPELTSTPSLRFGVELALLDAVARHREVPICGLLAAEHGRLSPDEGPLESVPVQFTIGAGTVEETLAAAQQAEDEGYSCVKLKVGAAPLKADITRVGRVCSEFPSLAVRLDANGAWTTDDALHLIRALSNGRIDLIEQPVSRANFAGFIDTYSEAGSRVAIAPDESCVPIGNARTLINDAQIGAIVVKPQALGGILPTCDLMDDAQRRGIRPILSTLLESAIGRSAIAHLAAAYPDVDGPHGLATGPWFREDLSDEPDRLEAGRMILRSGPGLGFEPVWRSH
jgi:o-succinylbenzoate synthase